MNSGSRRVRTSSMEETLALGVDLSKLYPPPRCIALFGDLGSGKTTLAKGLISNLCNLPEDAISSPTFTYLQSYPMSRGGFAHHFDLYRLSGRSEFIALGLEDYLEHPEDLCIFEWPEKVFNPNNLPMHTLSIFLSHEGPNDREIII